MEPLYSSVSNLIIDKAISSKTLKTTLSCKDLLEVLERMTKLDALAEEKIKSYNNKMGCTAILGILFLPIALLSTQAYLIGSLISILGYVLIIGAIIYFRKVQARYISQNFANEYREQVIPFLEGLHNHISESSKVDIKMQLATTENEPFKYESKDVELSSETILEVRSYYRPYLELNIELKDGNQLSIAGSEHIIRQRRIPSISSRQSDLRLKIRYEKKAKLEFSLQLSCSPIYRLKRDSSESMHDCQIETDNEDSQVILSSKIEFKDSPDPEEIVVSLLKATDRFYKFIER